MRRAPSLSLVLVACGIACGQTFEVASIKPSAPRPPNGAIRVGCSGGPGSKDPGRWSCQNYTLSSLINSAYALQRYQMPDSGSEQDRYDITATIPEGATKEQFRLMQQNLLKERFKLAAHFEKKEVSGYELVVGKGGLKIKEGAPPKQASDDAKPGPPGPPPRDAEGYPILDRGREGMAMMNGKASWSCPNCTIERIANMMATQLNAPVKDATGLTGKYDVDMKWALGMLGGAFGPGMPGPAPSAADPEGPTLVTALQEQLGLKLQSKKTPIDALVIDHVEKVPIEN